MGSFKTAVRFFYAMLRKRYVAGIRVENRLLNLANGKSLQCDRYIPPKKNVGTILFTHGMTKTAHRDPRIIDTARALVSLGFQVVLPCYPAIQNMSIVVDTVDDIAQSITALVAQGICTHGKLAIMSVSFSGIQALHAAAQEVVRDKVSGVLALGTAHTYQSTFQLAFAIHSKADLYTQLILLRNLLLLSNVASVELDQVFLMAIEAVYKNNDIKQLNNVVTENFSEETKQQFEFYREDLISARTFLQKYASTIQELDIAFAASGDLGQLKCPVFLIHSESDNVLMPSESVALYQELKNKHIPVKLTITPLLEHVNHQVSLKKIKELVALLNNFAGFFAAARG